MAWLRIDDGMMEHPKILGLTDREFRVHMNALCYTGRRRDPHVPTQALPILQGTRKHANRLETVGLWDRNGDGWVIHDWADYQGQELSRDDTKTVYVIRNTATGHVKVGHSKSPKLRLAQLQCSHSVKLELLATLPGINERNAHQILGGYRLSGEWFAVPSDVLATFIEEWS